MSLQTEALTSAAKNLQKELAAMARGPKPFLARYRQARLHAFELEFLAKFLRKSQAANQEIFERLLVITKEIEDRFGAFNEIDEMVSYSEERKIHLPDGTSAAAYFTRKRAVLLRELTGWMKANGWSGKSPKALDKISGLLAKLEDLDDESLRAAAIKKMTKVLNEIQDNVDKGAYAPRKGSGYIFSEVESKVHELRREIRKIPMYAGYLKGVFIIGARPQTKKSAKTVRCFTPLTKTALTKSEFAHLPKAKLKKPLEIAFPYFLAITRYVSELGFAKDWAQNIERLMEAGIPGSLSFDQLDPSLKDIFGRPLPFNLMAGKILDEIHETQIFRRMAEDFEAQKRR